MENLIAKLKQLQANTFVLYTTSHGFHWNVEGILFTQYHAFFEKIYTDSFEALDPIAENIKKLQGTAPFSLMEMADLNTYGDIQLVSTSPQSMSQTLLSMIERMIEEVKNLFDIATQEREQGIANFLADRQDQLEFFAWWLRASLKPTIN